jgi:hypothetical protein
MLRATCAWQLKSILIRRKTMKISVKQLAQVVMQHCHAAEMLVGVTLNKSIL